MIADGPGWEGLGDLVAKAAALASTAVSDPLNHVLGGYSRFRRYTPRMLRTLDIEASPAAGRRRRDGGLHPALVLVCLGVFGTVSQRVVRRRREFAIRMALGATRGRIARQVCAHGLRPVVAGLAVGLVVSLATARFIETLLFGVAPFDPVVLGGAALAVLGLGAGACVLRVPPARTLNAD